MNCRFHSGRDVLAKGLCASCYNSKNISDDPDRYARKLESNKAWRAANRDKLIAYQKDWRVRQRIRLGAGVARAKRVYNLSPGQYRDLQCRNSGLCYICNEVHGLIGVDHCHVSGKVRGWLCSRCNTALGLFRDRTDLLDAAKQYLLNS